MKKILSILSLLSLLTVSQIYASDILILDTLDESTVSPHRVRTQIGVEAEEQIDTSTLIHGPTFDAAFGIGEWAEFGLNYEVVTLTDSPSFDDQTGSGDLRLRLKAIPIKTGWGNLGFAMITKIPVANHEDGLGTDETDVILKAILGTTILEDLHLFANLGAAIQGDVLSESSQDDFFVWGIAAKYPLPVFWKSSLCKGVWLIGEFEGSTGPQNNSNISLGEFTDRDVEFRGGFVKELSWFNLGVTGSVGLNDDSPEWGVRVLLSRTFDVPGLSKE